MSSVVWLVGFDEDGAGAPDSTVEPDSDDAVDTIERPAAAHVDEAVAADAPTDDARDEVEEAAHAAPGAAVTETTEELEIPPEVRIRLAMSDEFDPLELSDIEHEVVEPAEKANGVPPPAPEAAKKARPTTPAGGPAANGTPPQQRRAFRPANEVDDLMSELLSDGNDANNASRVTSEEWWAEVFEETYLQLLPDAFYQRTLKECDFLLGAIAPPRGGRLLDVACGYGRHANELTGRGYSVTGVDLSKPLLKRALSEADRRGIDAEFLLGDMRELDFEGTFDGVYCWHTSFGYFDDATNLSIAKAMARALKPGGRLVIDQVNRDHVLRDSPKRMWWEHDELVVMDDISLEHTTSRLRIDRSVMDENQHPWEQRIRIRLYAAHEIEELMRQVGLEVLGLTGDIAHPGVYIGPENGSVIITARKPAE